MKKIISTIMSLAVMLCMFTYTGESVFASSPVTQITSTTTVPAGFIVRWNKISGVSGYEIQYATRSDFGNAAKKKVASQSATSHRIDGRAAEVRYYIRVRTYKNSDSSTDYSSWSSASSVVTRHYNEADPASIKTLATRENGFDVAVNEVSNATGYQVRYATRSDFGNARTDTFKGASNTTMQIKGRAYDAKYYVQSRTYRQVDGKNYYSAWSASKQVQTVSKYPAKTNLTQLISKGNGFGATVSRASNSTGYQIRYATRADFGNAKTDTFKGSDTTLEIGRRAYNTKYYVQARAYKTAGGKNYYSDWSDSKEITTAPDSNSPDSTVITGVSSVVNGFKLSWKAADKATGYQIQFATRSNFSNGATQNAGGTSKTVTGRAGNCRYYVRVRAYQTVNGKNHYAQWSPSKSVVTLNSYAGDLKEKGFPDSYIPALVDLHEKHPNWIFEPFNTGLNWNDAVNGERSPHRKQVIENYSGNSKSYFCSCSSCYKNGSYVVQEKPRWVSASKTAVEHYMNPKNFLNEQEIFQFESTKYNGTQTQSGVETILKGTWMYNSKISYLDANGKTKTINKKYSEAIIEASDKSGLSAYYLASKIRQEVGAPSPTAGGASGKVNGYKGIYNYYNICAYTGANDGLKWASAKATGAGDYTNCVCKIRSTPSTATSSNILYSSVPENTKVNIISTTAKQSDGYKWHKVSLTANGKSYTGYIRSDLIDHLDGTKPSYNRPWTDPYKSIVNGAQWIANNFGEQFTGYLQKFNVNPDTGQLYQHEYMANVQAAASEAKSTYNAYKNAGILNTTKTFSIPVFKNMP